MVLRRDKGEMLFALHYVGIGTSGRKGLMNSLAHVQAKLNHAGGQYCNLKCCFMGFVLLDSPIDAV